MRSKSASCQNMLKRNFRNTFYLPKTEQKSKIDQNAKIKYFKPCFLNYD